MDLQKYHTIEGKTAHKSWWDEKGYVQRLFNKETKKMEEKAVPYQNMTEALIGYAYLPWTSSRSTDRTIRFRVAANIVIQYKDKQTDQYLLFLAETQEDLAKWLQLFNDHTIPVYTTDLDLKDIPHKDYKLFYGDIKKKQLTSNSQLPDVMAVTKEHSTHPQWRPDSYQKREETSNSKWAYKKKKLTAFLAVSSFLTALFWIPGWEVGRDQSFDNVHSLFFSAMALILLGTYLKDLLSPYQSLMDTAVLGISLYAGLAAANLFTPITTETYLALWYEFLILAVYINAGYFIMRKVNKKLKRKTSRQ
ncbi:hypothetical protein AS034_14615 [[Bacillus] enclensis]|uniref:PH domain-containing protein n=1 Tax=[Bacillus] enclensis TaxID=1402860 RepID=A0A0V8HG84_9BACI|nr:hypothetical protein [[Bacillus] enclensis]KSU61566.1 hypothetical protein AS034_14615 [[Bacillus] enclensis]SCC19053.1 hypothetical protein GA0061094_3021 [[Bacillus] enclensis]